MVWEEDRRGPGIAAGHQQGGPEERRQSEAHRPTHDRRLCPERLIRARQPHYRRRGPSSDCPRLPGPAERTGAGGPPMQPPTGGDTRDVRWESAIPAMQFVQSGWHGGATLPGPSSLHGNQRMPLRHKAFHPRLHFSPTFDLSYRPPASKRAPGHCTFGDRARGRLPPPGRLERRRRPRKSRHSPTGRRRAQCHPLDGACH